MDARSQIALAVALAGTLVSGCLEFGDLSHVDDHCFDWAEERYVLCDGGAGEPSDAGIEDSGETTDSEVPDGAPRDAGPVDTGSMDADVDAGVRDTGEPDSGLEQDAGPLDTGVIDSGSAPDAEPRDAGPADTGAPPDSGPPDTGVPPDAGFPDSGIPPDAGFPDSGVTPDAGFPHAATITFTGPGTGLVFTDMLYAGGPVQRSYSCDYNGTAQTLVCYELLGGSFTTYLSATGAPLAVRIEFREMRTHASATGQNGSVVTSFTGDCTPPVGGNTCYFDYLPPVTTQLGATVRFD